MKTGRELKKTELQLFHYLLTTVRTIFSELHYMHAHGPIHTDRIAPHPGDPRDQTVPCGRRY